MKKEDGRKNQRYKKILNNLLVLKGRDPNIFTSIKGTSRFDVLSKFGFTSTNKILNKKEFMKETLVETDFEKLLNIVKNATESETIISAYKKYKINLYQTKKILLETSFSDTKEKLESEIKEKIQKMSNRWKQFKRKCEDLNIQHNIWPLHIATSFISVITENRSIYAPLLLKEVRLNVNGSKIELKPIGSWKLNEKIVFLLNSSEFGINENMDFEEKSIDDCLSIVSTSLNISPSLTITNLISEFKNIERQTIKNKDIIFHPGVVLGLFSPSGGALRKSMLEIITNNEVDDIINTLPNKRKYETNIREFVSDIDKSSNLIRVQKSNYSQDKALISSLIQDTVIWGPPGTGKSQVIANIIANVLYQKKTAVVMSQKKAALDVLRNRLGIVSPFAFFILNDNKIMKKSAFYSSLQKFIKCIESQRFGRKSDYEPKPIIKTKEINALLIIKNAKLNNEYIPSLNFIENCKFWNYKEETLTNILSLNTNYTYPKPKSYAKADIKNYIRVLAEKNNVIPRRFLFFKWFPQSFDNNCKNAFNLQKEKVKINKLDLKSKLNKNTLMDLITVPSKLLLSKNESRTLSQDNHTSQQEQLVSCLSRSIMTKIENWGAWGKRTVSAGHYKKYQSFANAIRSGRALPYKFSNKHIDIIKELFPIIITTPETTFINWEKKSFDYAILDESSQIFLEIGLPILYLAKTKIIAGDQKQLAPSRWFLIRDNAINDEEDIPENTESLLDYAIEKGVHQVLLDQNYRSSSAALMSFSAKQFYKSELEVIDHFTCKDKQSIEVINVNGIWNKSRTNEIEANKVIKLAADNLSKYETIIILAFNSNQKQLIEKNIIEQKPILYKAMNNQNLMIRNIENIQGDEADLVIISVVYDKDTMIWNTYVAKKDLGQKALNVAISRAKEKMIVVKSLNYKTVKSAKSKDFMIFKEWLHFLDLPYSDKKVYSSIKTSCIDKKIYLNKKNTNSVEKKTYFINNSYGETESNFEYDVVSNILNSVRTKYEYDLIKQYEVGSKRIDIAFICKKNKKYTLGLEVDGYRYHKGFDKYLKDQSRQNFLESKGYKIYRISEIDWKMDKQSVLKEIRQILNYPQFFKKTITTSRR